MMRWSRTHTLIAGLALILASNAIALVGVGHNRSGDPESIVTLTERELALPYLSSFEKENSGIGLQLNWRVPAAVHEHGFYGSHHPVEWLDAERLRALGYDTARSVTSPDAHRHYHRLPAREVLLVLEYDGPAYQAMLAATREWARRELARPASDVRPGKPDARADQVRRTLVREERANSRLFVVDAGLDRDALRARYPDRGRYLIVNGRIRPLVVEQDRQTRLRAYIEDIAVSVVNVPRPLHSLFAPLRESRSGDEGHPRYAVTVAFGQRLEPWIVSATATPLSFDRPR